MYKIVSNYIWTRVLEDILNKKEEMKVTDMRVFLCNVLVTNTFITRRRLF